MALLCEHVRIEGSQAEPPAEREAVDVAVLDMYHGKPNLGHACLVQAVSDAAGELLEGSERTGLRVRVLSFDVRRAALIPEPPGNRFALYLGTGGPGDPNPCANAGEDPRWEAPLHDLFDAILADQDAALLAVCHSFGLLCLWSGVARSVLRNPGKGGPSKGVVENVLAEEAGLHPWFRRLSADLGPPGRLRVLDHRYFDLIPGPPGVSAIGWETLGVGGPRGDAVTMIEWARDPGGIMPRIFGVNHHPEVGDRLRQSLILDQILARGAPADFVAQRRAELKSFPDELADSLRLTSHYTLLAPLRFHLCRQLRLRAESLGLPFERHEDEVIASPSFAAVPTS